MRESGTQRQNEAIEVGQDVSEVKNRQVMYVHELCRQGGDHQRARMATPAAVPVAHLLDVLVQEEYRVLKSIHLCAFRIEWEAERGWGDSNQHLAVIQKRPLLQAVLTSWDRS